MVFLFITQNPQFMTKLQKNLRPYNTYTRMMLRAIPLKIWGKGGVEYEFGIEGFRKSNILVEGGLKTPIIWSGFVFVGGSRKCGLE